ncbi:MAG: Tetratricopeptide 2 repeat protein, partial [Verrucomicrobiales bacterium]|nr:Tetratricopeptide 2 repeat protein [Verrucomicrobiales bacterium]
MRRLFSVVALFLSLSFLSTRAAGPDDDYVDAYQLIQDADTLAGGGQGDRANQKYREAEAALKSIQSSYPNWNAKTIEFRLRYIEQQLNRPVSPVTSATPRPNRPGTLPRPLPMVKPTIATNSEILARDQQITNLTETIHRMEADRNTLNAKLQEALSAQPAASDPKELAKAEDRIKALEKEKELLRVSVEQERSDPLAAQVQKRTAEFKEELARREAALAAERDAFQKQVKAARDQSRAVPENDITVSNQELQKKVASLQQSLSALEAEKATLEKQRPSTQSPGTLPSLPKIDSRATEWQAERDDLLKKLNEANRQIAQSKTRKEPPNMSSLTNQLVLLRSRLEILEARKVPYTPEELALFKKGDELALKTPAVKPKGSKKSVKDIPAGAGPLVTEAQRAFAAQRFDEAEKKYEQVLKMDEKSVFTLGNLAAIEIQQNRLDAAENNLNKALAIEPTDGYSLSLMGIVKFDREKYDEALDFLSRASEIDPSNAETQNYLGITLSQKGQRAPAETALRKAIVLQPNYSAAHNNLAVIYATQQPPALELARYHYQKALNAGHPKNPQLEAMLEKKEV